MKTNKILSILTAVVLGWMVSLSGAHASVGANPNDYTKKIMLDRFDKVKADLYYAAKTTGMDMGDLVAISSIESGLIAKSKNPHSSASGMLGHTRGTWVSERKAYHSQVGLPANVKVTNPRGSLLIGAAGLIENKRFIVEKTHLAANQVRLGDQYMAHFLGRDMAVRVLNSNSGTPMSKLVRISKGNWQLFVKPNGKVRTAREFRLYLDQLVKRERSFYNEEVRLYAAVKHTDEFMDSYTSAGNELQMAQFNTSKYIGWGS